MKKSEIWPRFSNQLPLSRPNDWPVSSPNLVQFGPHDSKKHPEVCPSFPPPLRKWAGKFVESSFVNKSAILLKFDRVVHYRPCNESREGLAGRPAASGNAAQLIFIWIFIAVTY